MSGPATSSAALPIAYVVLRILIVVNWLGGAAIVVLLVAMPTRQWIMSSLELSPSPEADRVVMGLRAIAKHVSPPEHPLNINAGFSINGWLAVLLTFLLGRVFAEGTLMREDLEGMV
jgi:hypothetical protein